MCLAIPGKIVKVEGDIATVGYPDEQRTARIVEGEFSAGDYCIVQGGIVAMKLPKEEAEDSLRLYAEATSQEGPGSQ
ncbi:MAG: HypC/HybG/HupF family hydrogenase formation chaperone [archaeon]